MECSEEQRALVSLINALEGRFPSCSRAEVEDVVCEEYAAFNSGPVRTMVPLFVEHAAVKRLRGRVLYSAADLGR
ncbi:three-helix bundle dimerization domain-containing protein [Pseudarthrobacter equi]|uniref:three-helix bundle dimerization domain-containing protein n=1 Tax=Pseudarthrobacter TaxID=1742993 RepID=UPI0037CB6BC5